MFVPEPPTELGWCVWCATEWNAFPQLCVWPSQHWEDVSACVWFLHTRLRLLFVKWMHILMVNWQCVFSSSDFNYVICWMTLNELMPIFGIGRKYLVHFSFHFSAHSMHHKCMFLTIAVPFKRKKKQASQKYEMYCQEVTLLNWNKNRIYLLYCVSISMFWRSLIKKLKSKKYALLSMQYNNMLYTSWQAYICLPEVYVWTCSVRV